MIEQAQLSLRGRNPKQKETDTYLRLLNLPLGLLINFGVATFKEGCKRIVNGNQSFVSSCLRVNQGKEELHG